jgi:hypothetical protein
MLENIDTNLTYLERLANFLSIIAILLNGATVLYLIISEAISENTNFTAALVCSIISLVLIIPTIYYSIRYFYTDNDNFEPDLDELVMDFLFTQNNLKSIQIISFLMLLSSFVLLLVYLILVCTTDDNPNLNRLWESILIIDFIIAVVSILALVSILCV